MAGEKKNKRNIILIFGAILLLLGVIGSCTGGGQSASSSTSSEVVSSSVTTETISANQNASSKTADTDSKSLSPDSTQETTNDQTDNENQTENDASGNEQIDNTPITEKYATEIVVNSKMTLDNFIANYDISLAPQNWTIAKWDDAAIIATTEVVLNGSSLKQTAMVIFTPIFEEEKMVGGTPHFVAVGDTVFGDDGYCDEVFSKLQDIANIQS